MKASRSVASGASVDLADFGERAEMVIAQARERAGEILSDARGERDQLAESEASIAREKGEREGYQAGLERGRKEGRELALRETQEQISALCDGLGGALARLNKDRGVLVAQARDDLLELAIRLNAQITRRRLVIEPGLVAGQVEAAIEIVSHASHLTVVLHPDDDSIVREVLGDAGGDGESRFTIVGDHTIERGGCILRNKRGVLADATISKQLERIVRAILPDAPDTSGEVAA